MEDDFYGTIKFKNGEEVFAKIAASEETDRTMLVIHHPITVCEVKSRAGTVGYIVEPWLRLLEKICLLLIWIMFLPYQNLMILK